MTVVLNPILDCKLFQTFDKEHLFKFVPKMVAQSNFGISNSFLLGSFTTNSSTQKCIMIILLSTDLHANK